MCLKYSADLKIVALLFMCVTFVQREYVKGGAFYSNGCLFYFILFFG